MLNHRPPRRGAEPAGDAARTWHAVLSLAVVATLFGLHLLVAVADDRHRPALAAGISAQEPAPPLPGA
jgi:uncharacterized iron-regulated membrane protein